MNQDIEQSIEENLAQNGFHVSTTSGYSMYPMLRDRRDRVVILPTDGKRLKRYDLPLYKKPNGKYVLHRILRVKKDHYVIRGDNTYRLERIPFDWVIGYVDEFTERESTCRPRHAHIGCMLRVGILSIPRVGDTVWAGSL